MKYIYHNEDKVIICQLVQKYPKVNDYLTPGEIMTYRALSSKYPNVLEFPNAFRLHEKYVEPQEAKSEKPVTEKSVIAKVESEQQETPKFKSSSKIKTNTLKEE